MPEQYSISQGSAKRIEVTLRAEGGAVVVDFAGTEPLSTVMWPGGAREASATPPTTWVDASRGRIDVMITEAVTAALEAGRYQLVTRINDAGTLVDVYACTIDITPYVGMELAPKVYGTYSEMQDYGGSWLGQLSTSNDQAGFIEERARARQWLEDIAHAHHRSGGWVPAPDVLGGPRLWSGRSTTLQAWLDADRLIVTSQVREAVAKHALSLICERQIGTGDSAMAYARLAKMYRSQADSIAACLVLEIDVDGDGLGDLAVDCSLISPLYG